VVCLKPAAESGGNHREVLQSGRKKTVSMKKKPATKSKRRAKRASTRDLVAKGKSVTGGREPTQHPAKVTVPDIK
jgi:hypothetical protein